MLKIYNSLTKQKEVFTSVREGEVSLYSCGMTVYDYCHIGHARSYTVFDTAVRYLRDQGYRVTYVRNITDIDDKIIRRADENDESWQVLAERFITIMNEDFAALGLDAPDHEPRATHYIAKIILLIEQILERGHAYVAENGDVCFNVRRMPGYGKLSHRDVDELRSGARVDIDEKKRDPLDFVLWKRSKLGEPEWDSPWGRGRPGWHIECSAMATDKLGQPFDIHGGGLDLKFPHHENEIAQSESACEAEFARVWMHVGLLQIRREKMSKSLRNFITIRDALKMHAPEVWRYFFLSSHYRSPINYSEENITQAKQSLTRLYNALRGLDLTAVDSAHKAVALAYHNAFEAAMNDDFNTPKAFSVLFDMAHAISKYRELGELDQAIAVAACLKRAAAVVGLLRENPDAFLKAGAPEICAEEIEVLIEARRQARIQKNWLEADRIRDDLAARGITLEDKDGTTLWRAL